MAQPHQIVRYLFLLVPELFFVGQILPFTPAANTEMLAKRIYPQRRISVKFHDTCLGIIMLLTHQLQIHYISRCCKRDAYTALKTAIPYVKERFGITLPEENTVCGFYPKNGQCLGERCPYNPGYKK